MNTKTLSALLVLSLLSVSMVTATPSTSINLIDNEINPIYTESAFTPLVFLNMDGGRVLVDDPYGFFANGDITKRENNYAFTGEQITWEVLVWDKNGVPEKISDVYSGWSDQVNGALPPEIQANCQMGTQLEDGANLADAGYPNVRRSGDQEAQVNFNSQTMGIYSCTLTIEPTCHGQKWFGVEVEDLSGLTSQMQEAESWFCNPSLDLGISGSLNFGELGSGEQGSATISVENQAETGSGMEIVLAISGTDFYDASPSGGMCPTSNQMKLQGDGTGFTTGFWYTAVQGANSVGAKRIPYGTSIVDSDPIFSSSSASNSWKKWSGALTPMSVGSEASITFHLGIPQPCNGEFTNGDIILYGLAI